MDESGSHETATVLIIDDEPQVLEHCREILEGAGYRVLTAEDGQEGLEIFRAQHETIDVAIVDWILPDLDGRVWIDCLLEVDPRVRVIFLTGHRIDEVTWEQVEHKISSLLNKPFSVEELLQAVARALGA